MSEPQLPASASSRQTAGGGVKDTIESILVAFILAFVFRAFVVEAFVIPTGSMATTLLGAHTRFHCPDCGYDFDVNYQPKQQSGVPEAEDPAIPAVAPEPLSNPVYCPNCGCQMPDTQTEKAPVFYGDRILVLKYLYMLREPQRFDVVVFKAPIAMTTNYIKRLIGKPGEAVMVIDGDVYIRPPNAKNPDEFVVQPKPKAVQDALWRLVYDNDFHPSNEGSALDRDVRRGLAHPFTQPWTVVNGTGWTLNDPATNGRIFSFVGDNNSSRLRFDPQANPTAQTESDYLVYDQQSEPRQIPVRPVDSHFPIVSTDSSFNNEIPVSDLDLRLTYQRNAGDGPLHLTLTKRDHAFTAEITATHATVYHDFNGHRSTIGTQFEFSPSNHPMRIEFTNSDYQITLRINEKIVAQSTPADFSPDLAALVREFDDRRTPRPAGLKSRPPTSAARFRT